MVLGMLTVLNATSEGEVETEEINMKPSTRKIHCRVTHADGPVVLRGGLSNGDGLDFGTTGCDCLSTFSGMSTVFRVPAYINFIIL